MNSDSATANLQLGSSETDISSSGKWETSFVKRPSIQSRIRRKAAGLVMLMSPTTLTLDYWVGDRRDSYTAGAELEVLIGRSISRVEALRIAQQIIESAERERIQVAVWEADQGIQWEDDE